MSALLDTPLLPIAERALARPFAYPDAASLGYAQAVPFPHVVLRDRWDAALVADCKQQIARFEDWDGEKDFFGSRRKRYCGDIDRLPPAVVRVIREASTPRFLRWLGELTGEPCLLPDPYLEGGGIHQIVDEGFLKVHADFNWNERLGLYRRLNLLLYLNPGWNADWGGALELWEKDMSRAAVVVPPVANTMVVFTTDDRSFHGHPHPLACPPGVTRDSIALYYYSPIRPKTNFRARRIGTDYRPIQGDAFQYYDTSLSARIRNRLRKLVAR